MKNQIKKLGEFYSVDEVAEMFGVESDTVYSWIYMGKLTAYHLDGIIRISEFHLEKCLENMMIFTMSKSTIENDSNYPDWLEWIKRDDEDNIYLFPHLGER